MNVLGFQCEYCYRLFETLEAQIMHKKKEHPKPNNPNPAIFQPMQKVTNDNLMTPIQTMLLQNPEGGVCLKCGTCFTSDMDHLNHIIKDDCDSSVQNLTDSTLQVDPLPKPHEDMIIDNHPNQDSSSPNMDVRDSGADDDTCKPSPSNRYSCACGVTYNRLSHLPRHSKKGCDNVRGRKRVKCSLCGLSFATAWSMKHETLHRDHSLSS